VTALTVTTPGPQGGLTAPARAVPGIRPRRGERPPAGCAYPAADAGEPLFHLPSHAPDRRLGRAQLGDHPRLDSHFLAEDLETEDALGQDGVLEPLLGGTPGHVTTIAVTHEPVPLHCAGRDTERTTS